MRIGEHRTKTKYNTKNKAILLEQDILLICLSHVMPVYGKGEANDFWIPDFFQKLSFSSSYEILNI